MYYVKVFHIEAFMRLSRVLTVFFSLSTGWNPKARRVHLKLEGLEILIRTSWGQFQGESTGTNLPYPEFPLKCFLSI